MPSGLIGSRIAPRGYNDWSLVSFPDWRTLQEAALEISKKKPNVVVNQANKNFEDFINQQINGPAYGLFGKNPRSYKEALEREKFLYYDDYKRIKDSISQEVLKKLAKSSVAEAMKPNFVYNDRELGEFVFARASMALQPEMYYYCPKQKREVNFAEVDVKSQEGNMMRLKNNGDLVVFAFKVTKEDGSVEYVEVDGEESLRKANEVGIIDCTSTNKKVYLYKEKKPKQYNAVKLVVALTAGGFTSWTNDFYTGICAAVVLDVLESLGYSVHVEIVVGGGRCSGCYRKLNFGGKRTHGRRFFTFTAKPFDDQLDKDGLLYTLCDPSFHNIKFISLLNHFFNYYGDEVDTNGSPASTWHGIEEPDLVNPIGAVFKHEDGKKGDKNLLHFYIHKVGSPSLSTNADIKAAEADVAKEIFDIVETCENLNLQALLKSNEYDFAGIAG